METKVRSIAKALTWRAGGLIVTCLVAWIVTGKPLVAASIGLADSAAKVVVFYFHERLWLRIHFGRLHPPDYQI
ncbi:MAG: DUF2061 domain-containing protein [Planctomycetes bacterium]|nr:DUF2061 domain-containing protein [Planctomycetota bacterium]